MKCWWNWPLVDKSSHVVYHFIHTKCLPLRNLTLRPLSHVVTLKKKRWPFWKVRSGTCLFLVDTAGIWYNQSVKTTTPELSFAIYVTCFCCVFEAIVLVPVTYGNTLKIRCTAANACVNLIWQLQPHFTDISLPYTKSV